MHTIFFSCGCIILYSKSIHVMQLSIRFASPKCGHSILVPTQTNFVNYLSGILPVFRTFSASLVPCEGSPPVTSEFLSGRANYAELDVYLNKVDCWWFDVPSGSCNASCCPGTCFGSIGQETFADCILTCCYCFHWTWHLVIYIGYPIRPVCSSHKTSSDFSLNMNFVSTLPERFRTTSLKT